MSKIEKILLSVAVIFLSFKIIGATLYDAKLLFILSRYSEETFATVIDSKESIFSSRKTGEVYILTVEYTDKYNKTYITNIRSQYHLYPGNTIKIIYSKFFPKVADIKGNHGRKLDFYLELYYSFMIIIVAIYYYQEFKSTPDYWKSKKNISISFK